MSFIVDIKAKSLIVTNYGIEFDSPGANWIALNPQIGKEMGWHFDANGLFRWIDNVGEVMAESIWWIDGYPIYNLNHLEAEVGTGWIAAISEMALNMIKENFRKLNRVSLIERSFYEEGRKAEKTATKLNQI